MTTKSELPLSSLLEKAQYIKKAMGNIEQEITNQTFEVRSNKIQVNIKGTCIVDQIIIDSDIEDQPIKEILPQIVATVNQAIREIDNKRQQAFKTISQNIQDEEDN